MANNNKNNKNKRNNSFNMSKISNNFKILLCLILVIILVLIVNKKYNNHSHYVEKFNNTDLNNQFKKSNYIIEPSQDYKEPIHYLYWTGGYDSTFRLCEMLIDERKRVQPIYVALVLDNDCQSEETCTKLWLRRNRKEEKMAMDKIVEQIKEDFPHVANNLLPTLVIDEPIKDDVFNFNYEKLFYSKNLWPKKRKKHQYLFLTKYAYYHKKNIDIGVLGIHEKSTLAKFLGKNLVKTEDNYVITKKNHPLTYINFPLYGRSKEDLLEKAKVNGYDHILNLTWSCWFPKKGTPCGKCPMCKERIVAHPDNSK